MPDSRKGGGQGEARLRQGAENGDKGAVAAAAKGCASDTAGGVGAGLRVELVFWALSAGLPRRRLHGDARQV